MGVPFLPARSDRAADSFWDEAVPGLFSGNFFMVPIEDRDKFCGMGFLLADASAFKIVCLGIDSTDKALLRWPWNDFGTRVGKTGDDGREAVSLGEVSPTVVAAEKDSEWS